MGYMPSSTCPGLEAEALCLTYTQVLPIPPEHFIWKRYFSFSPPSPYHFMGQP